MLPHVVALPACLPARPHVDVNSAHALKTSAVGPGWAATSTTKRHGSRSRKVSRDCFFQRLNYESFARFQPGNPSSIFERTALPSPPLTLEHLEPLYSAKFIQDSPSYLTDIILLCDVHKITTKIMTFNKILALNSRSLFFSPKCSPPAITDLYSELILCERLQVIEHAVELRGVGVFVLWRTRRLVADLVVTISCLARGQSCIRPEEHHSCWRQDQSCNTIPNSHFPLDFRRQH